MALKILTRKEADKMKALCKKFGEFYYEQEGVAKDNFLCDNSNDVIPVGKECVAVVILPTENHPNRDYQIGMIKDYIFFKTS